MYYGTDALIPVKFNCRPGLDSSGKSTAATDDAFMIKSEVVGLPISTFPVNANLSLNSKRVVSMADPVDN